MSLQNQCSSESSSDETQVCCGARLQGRMCQRRSSAALAGIRDIVSASSDFEDGTIGRTFIIKVDEEEVWWAAPVT